MNKLGFLAAICMMFVLSAPAYASTEAIPDVIKKMRSSASEIKDMKCIFTKKITKKGVIIPETAMEFRYLKSPETLYVEFLNRYKGQKCLYIKGQNDGKMIVKPSGLMSFMKLNLDPTGELAMEESLDPMTGMDFNSTISALEELLKKGQAQPGGKAEFIKDIKDGDQSFHLIKCFSTSDKNVFFHMYIDRQTFLPRKIQYKDGNNMATYVYSDIAVNSGLNEKDVTID